MRASQVEQIRSSGAARIVPFIRQSRRACAGAPQPDGQEIGHTRARFNHSHCMADRATPIHTESGRCLDVIQVASSACRRFGALQGTIGPTRIGCWRSAHPCCSASYRRGLRITPRFATDAATSWRISTHGPGVGGSTTTTSRHHWERAEDFSNSLVAEQ